MGSPHRTVLTTKHKVVLWCLGLIVLWEVLQSNAVLEALLTFGFAGVIPGTGIVLSPDAVIMVTGIALLLVFAAIILRALLKRPKERIPANVERATQAIEHPYVGLAPIAEHQLVTAVASAAAPQKPMQPTVWFRMRARLHTVWARMEQSFLHYSGIVLTWLDKQMPIVARFLRRVGQIVWAIGLIVFVFSRKWAIIGARFVQKYAKQLWVWLVPYLWKFDEWLELKVRAFTKWARFKSKQYHSLTIIISMFRQYKKMYSQSPLSGMFKQKPKAEQKDEA